MTTVTSPFLAESTRAGDVAAHTNLTSAQHSEASREKRFRLIRLGVLATAGALGPLIVLLVGNLIGGHPDCRGCEGHLRSSDAAVWMADAPHASVTGGRVPSWRNRKSNSLVIPADDVGNRNPSGREAAVSGLFQDPAWHEARAAQLARSWGLGDRIHFSQIAAEGDSIESVAAGGGDIYRKAVVIAFVSGEPPIRRLESQPYMSIEASETNGLSSVIPVAAINSAAGLLEKSLGRLLFPIRLETAVFNKSSSTAPPFAMFDVSSGRIVLDHTVVAQMRTLPRALTEGLGIFAESLFSQAARAVSSAQHAGLGGVAQVVLRAAVAAIGVAVAYQVPLWFCVACPAVLGLLAPLAFNAGLGALANYACEHWALPVDECNDLWYGAFAAAMVLSLASAVPIVFICRLPQCARRQ